VIVTLLIILSVLVMLLGAAVAYRVNQIINERKVRGNE
jgi:hypothetical protein